MLLKKFDKIKIFIPTLGICAVLFFFITPAAHAQTNLINPLGINVNGNITSIDTWQQFIGLIIKAIIGLTGTATLLVLVWGGFLWLTAAGEEKRIKAGINTIVWAVIGLGVIFGAYAILDFIIKSALNVV